MGFKSISGTGLSCEHLESRRLLASYPASIFSPPIGTETDYDLSDSDGPGGSAFHNSDRTTFNGVAITEATFADRINGEETTQTTDIETTSKGPVILDQRFEYPSGDELDFQSPDGLADDIPTLVPGVTTKLPTQKFKVVLSTLSGDFSGSGAVTQTVTVNDFERVDSGFVFADALKITISQVRTYSISASDGRTFGQKENDVDTEWVVRGVGLVKEVEDLHDTSSTSDGTKKTDDHTVTLELTSSEAVKFNDSYADVTKTVNIDGDDNDNTIEVKKDSKTQYLALVDDIGRDYTISDVKQFNIRAGKGADIVTIGPGVPKTYVDGGAGNDSITGGDGNDTITGGAGKNTLIGGDGDDRINGSGGRDLLEGGAGNDRLYGNGGDDTLDGGGGSDHLFGGDGNDSLLGGSSNDSLFGEAGNDTLDGQKQNDLLDGGAGSDYAIIDAGDSTVSIERTSTMT